MTRFVLTFGLLAAVAPGPVPGYPMIAARDNNRRAAPTGHWSLDRPSLVGAGRTG
jgi:hypothetical protein